MLRVHQSCFQVGLDIKIQNSRITTIKRLYKRVPYAPTHKPSSSILLLVCGIKVRVSPTMFCVNFMLILARVLVDIPRKITQFCVYLWLFIVLNLVRNIFSRNLNPEGQPVLMLGSFQVYKEDFASSKSVAVFSLQHPSYRTLRSTTSDGTDPPIIFNSTWM